MPGTYRLVGHPPLHVVRQRTTRGVAFVRAYCHRLLAHRFECRVERLIDVSRQVKLPPLHGLEHFADIPRERRPASQQAIQGGTEAVYIGTRA